MNFDLSHSKSHAPDLPVVPSPRAFQEEDFLNEGYKSTCLISSFSYFFTFSHFHTLILEMIMEKYKKHSFSVYLALYKSASVQVDVICTSVIVVPL